MTAQKTRSDLRREAVAGFHVDIKPVNPPRPEEPVEPTPERKARGDLRQDVTKRYRAVPVVEQLLKAQRITPEQFQAATKYADHYERAGLRGTVRCGLAVEVIVDGGGGESGAEKRTYHAVLLAQAREELLPRTALVVDLVLCQDNSPSAAGRLALGLTDRGQAAAAALTLLRDGLDRLAIRWGFMRRSLTSANG